MTPPSGARRRHLPSSPFKPEPEPVVKDYDLDDLVSHDSYGVGRVVAVDATVVTVDFGSQKVRVTRTSTKLEVL